MKILENSKIDFKIINYLEAPLTKVDIRNLLGLLKLKAKEIIRKNEAEFKLLNLSNEDLECDEMVIKAIIKSPKILQRPIIVSNNKAVIGRPPEKIYEILQ